MCAEDANHVHIACVAWLFYLVLMCERSELHNRIAYWVRTNQADYQQISGPFADYQWADYEVLR